MDLEAEGSADRAIVVAEPHSARVPRLELARSLDEARPGTFVHIDGTGQVRSPARFRAIGIATRVTFATAAVALFALYTTLFGPLGAAAIALWSGWTLRQFWLMRRLELAAVLLGTNRLDEAHAVLGSLAKRAAVGRVLRGLIHQNTAALHTRRGEHAEALRETHEAIIAFRRSWRRVSFPWLRMCEYGEVHLLCNLGRLRDARERLNVITPRMEGDLLVVSRWGAELYLQFCEGKLRLDNAALWERAQRALRMSSSSVLLALCGWAYAQRGDVEMASHLLDESFDRRAAFPIDKTNPPLWAWMQSFHARAAATPAREG